MADLPYASDPFQNAPTGLVVVDQTGVVTKANARACRLIEREANGRCPEGWPLAEAFADRHANTIRQSIESAIAGQEPGPIFTAFRGTTRRVELRFATCDGPCCVVSLADVTSLVDAEQRLAAHFTRTPLASIEWNLDRTARLWNPAAERIFGFTAQQAAERDLFPELVAPESRASVDRVWQALLTATGGEAITNTNVTADGRTILCRWYNAPLRDPNGNVVAVASLAEDITERELAERRLRESERRLRAVVNRLPVLVWALDETLRPAFWNEHAQGLTGIEPEDIIAAPDGAERIFPADANHLAEFVSADFDNVERPIHCTDGAVRRVLWSNVAARCPIPDWAAWGVGIDVTELRRATLAARESERRFREVFHAVELAGILIDPDARVLDCNDAMVAVLELPRDQIIGADWIELGCPPKERDTARQELALALSRGVYTRRIERRVISPSGRVREMIWTRSLLRNESGRPVAACAFALDVSETRRAEAELTRHRDRLEQLVQERTTELAQSTIKLSEAQRLASIGQLAAGVGHDVGNILLPVRCHLDAIVSDPNADIPAAVDAVKSGLDVLARLADSLRSMRSPDHDDSDAEEGQPPVDLARWWRDNAPLILAAVPADISVRDDIARNPVHVKLSDHRLTQALLNLVLNAVDAIEAKPDGLVRITIDATDADAVIRVEDNGRGMTEDVRARAFEPFFSTRTRAMSTGLGLSIVHGFVTGAGGTVAIESEPGQGTVVTMRLPTAADPDPGRDSTSQATAVLHIGDARVRGIHETILRELGWTIIEEQDRVEPPGFAVVDGSDNPPIHAKTHTIRLVSDADSEYPQLLNISVGLAELKRFYSRIATDRGISRTRPDTL